MFALNLIQIIGYLTHDPDIRKTSTDLSVCDLTIATVSSFVKADGTTSEAKTFHNVTFWKGLADIIGQRARAGTQMYVSGHLQTSSWEDQQGVKKFKTKIIASDMILLDPKDPLEALPSGSPLSNGLNRAEVIGNLTRDPELRQTSTEQSVCTFSVATDRVWRDSSGEQQKQTEFHNIVAWGKLAEDINKAVTKGKKVYINGRLQVRSWETPDGVKKFMTEIVAETILPLGHPTNDPSLISPPSSRSEPMVGAPKETTPKEMPKIPEVKYESDTKPEDLPF